MDGPPFDTATGLVDGTANTVAWYAGDNATDDPRQSALARGDQSLVVGYGARANEQGLRTSVQSLAVFAATQFSATDPNGEAQYTALKQRIGSALNGAPNQQSSDDISGQLAGAQVALNDAKDRHDQTNTTLQSVNARMSHDLKAAAKIQRTFLPRVTPGIPGVQFAWSYQPCDELAGDGLNIIALEKGKVGLYILDVSGHGVSSALLSVTLARSAVALASPGRPCASGCVVMKLKARRVYATTAVGRTVLPG